MGFKDLVKNKWNKGNVKRNNMRVVKEKFKRMDQELKIWNRDTF